MSKPLPDGPAALNKLFAEFRPNLERFVRSRLDPRLRARVDPDDVVQEAHVHAVSGWEKVAGSDVEMLRGWLILLARDAIRELGRKHLGAAMRSVTKEVSAAGEPAVGTTPSLVALRGERDAIVAEALAALSATDRTIIEVREICDPEEAAALLGLTRAAAGMRLVRAYRNLKAELEKRGMTKTGALL